VKDIYDIVSESEKWSGQPLALATLVHAEGSSYRRPGARLLICPDGRTIGSLSGGCLEDEIAERARSVLESGKPLQVNFDTRRRFGCHGKIDILIERVREEFLSTVRSELDARRSCMIVTTSDGSFVSSSCSRLALSRRDDSASSSENGDRAPLLHQFTQLVEPPIRLLIFGEGPDTAPLQKLCEVVGWKSLEITNTRAFAFEPDHRTAAIVKSHNFGRDFAALARLLPLSLRYVGLIGPKKRRDELLNGLLEIGVSMNTGFFAPAGIDLNAETPEEIALAIISEIQRVFGDGSDHSLRDRKLPIHRKNTLPAPGGDAILPFRVGQA
jgi:xanthine/CO dehydrogenase XdhC/CoxF family maturation factor